MGPIGPKNSLYRRRYGKNTECMFGSCLGHLYCKFMEIIGLKALGNYFAAIWFNRFSICSWENTKTLISMISGFSDVSPAHQLFLSLETPRYLNKINKIPGKVQKIIFSESHNFVNRTFVFVCKRRAPTNSADPFNEILRNVKLGSISS